MTHLACEIEPELKEVEWALDHLYSLSANEQSKEAFDSYKTAIKALKEIKQQFTAVEGR